MATDPSSLHPFTGQVFESVRARGAGYADAFHLVTRAWPDLFKAWREAQGESLRQVPPLTDRAKDALMMLAWHYGVHESFMTEFRSLVERRRESWDVLANARGWPNGLNPVGLTMDEEMEWCGLVAALVHWLSTELEHLTEPSDDVDLVIVESARLAGRWGLRAAWGPGLIVHAAARSVRFGVGQGGFWYGGITNLRIPRREVDLRPLWAHLGIDWLPLRAIAAKYRGVRTEFREPAPGEVAEPIGWVVREPDTLKEADLPPSAWFDAPTILLVQEYNPTNETREAFEGRAVQALRRQMDAVDRAYLAAGERKFGGKSSLGEHVRWLFLATCPDQAGGRARTYEEIWAGEAATDTRTVSKAVQTLARQLGLDYKRPGRPRKGQSRV